MHHILSLESNKFTSTVVYFVPRIESNHTTLQWPPSLLSLPLSWTHKLCCQAASQRRAFFPRGRVEHKLAEKTSNYECYIETFRITQPLRAITSTFFVNIYYLEHYTGKNEGFSSIKSHPLLNYVVKMDLNSVLQSFSSL